MHNNQRKTIYLGKIVNLGLETIVLANGELSTVEIVRHPGGAGIVALDQEHRVCLLRQYRLAISRWIWEIPAGLMENNEAPLTTAKRELREEAGLEAGRWQSLGSILPAPGFCNEEIFLYEARGITFVGSSPDIDEQFEIHWKPLAEAINMASNGQISDSKTIAALFRANQMG